MNGLSAPRRLLIDDAVLPIDRRTSPLRQFTPRPGRAAHHTIEDEHDAEMIRFFLDELARRTVAAGIAPELSGQLLLRV